MNWDKIMKKINKKLNLTKLTNKLYLYYKIAYLMLFSDALRHFLTKDG